MDNRYATRISTYGLMVGLLLMVGAGPASAQALTDAERDGYLVWLHSLETTMAAREANDQPEVRVLFPAGVLAATGQVPSATSDLRQVALALGELEAKPRLLQEPSRRTTLHALNRARNYAHLAEYDSALIWYDAAARRDSTGEYTAAVGLETLIAAVAEGDSVRVVRQFLSAFGSGDLAGRRTEIELTYRFLVARADTTNLELVVREMAVRPVLLHGRLAYWQAFSLAWLGRWDASLEQLRGLLIGGGLSQGLAEDQRTWVLVAVPDLLLLTGHTDLAATLYQALAASSIETAASWAICQTAALDFLAGRFLTAGTAFERICEGSMGGTWRAYACSMAELSDEMERLRFEGEPHGVAVYYQR